MAPLTRSSSKTGGPLQARAKPEPQVLWFGEPNADQDIRIRLVGNKIRNKVDDDHTLALLMVHSSRLEKYNTYFSALLSPRWGSKRKRSPDDITLHVISDVELYTDCFSRMYNPLEVGHSLELLPVATHLAYDDLMSSICMYVASICPWTCHEELRIQKAVSSEAFPRGQAKDLLERLEGCLTSDDLRSLVTRCMKSLRKYDRHFPREGRELVKYVLETAGVQERGPIPTFEQEVVTILNEEFKLLLVVANDEALQINGNDEVAVEVFIESRFRMLGIYLVPIVEVLEIMLATGTSIEGVKSFVECGSIATFLDKEVISTNLGLVFYELVDDLACTLVTILKEVLDGNNLPLRRSHRNAFSLNWANWASLLNRMYWIESNHGDAGAPVRFLKEYSDLYECLLSDPRWSQYLIDAHTQNLRITM